MQPPQEGSERKRQGEKRGHAGRIHHRQVGIPFLEAELLDEEVLDVRFVGEVPETIVRVLNAFLRQVLLIHPVEERIRWIEPQEVRIIPHRRIRNFNWSMQIAAGIRDKLVAVKDAPMVNDVVEIARAQDFSPKVRGTGAWHRGAPVPPERPDEHIVSMIRYAPGIYSRDDTVPQASPNLASGVGRNLLQVQERLAHHSVPTTQLLLPKPFSPSHQECSRKSRQ